MSLGEAARSVEELFVSLEGDRSALVTGLAHDSRNVTRGDLFVCVPGRMSDGHLHAAQALDAGAVALVVERPLGTAAPELVVTDSRRALGRLAAELLKRPADALELLLLVGLRAVHDHQIRP